MLIHSVLSNHIFFFLKFRTPSFSFGLLLLRIVIASGVTVDHAYDVQGILHSYLLELRDTGEYGVALPIDQLIPTAIETWNGIKAMAFEILRAH